MFDDGSKPIEARGLVRTFRQGEASVPAVDDVSLSIEAGELVAVMGPSGSGKSTLLHLLGGLDEPDRGEVLVRGRRISGLPERELVVFRRRQLGFLLQFFSLLPTLSAIENVAFPLLMDGVEDAESRARVALEEVGLARRLDHRPEQLSGGEQQRVALARALVSRPAVVLADEPTGSLDSAGGAEILRLLQAMADNGQAIVIVTHDDRAASCATRIVHLRDGKIVASSEPGRPRRPESRGGTAGDELPPVASEVHFADDSA